ncbi:GlxA family transcriptional regulator [Jiella sonneratiae]|uniref:GlxA family transcriptional regulator n=1 Tax=Jiella sonneratiae TaxID=2816856 RepID=A0ABS3J3D4_9HYPH|nr:GlxA family transcriptional regulator [Jiella sonneratiae]MBO0904183.1 GlxA family transcriptional regulator [Jiella sonneratiae]
MVGAAADQPRRTIVFLLVPNFSMIAFANAVEPLRIANRIVGRETYRWRLASPDGGSVEASNGVACSVSASVEEERRLLVSNGRPSMIFACSGIAVEEFGDRQVFSYLREAHQRGVSVGGLCTGAWLLARAGLLSGRKCAIHWENLAGFAEAFPLAEVYADLFEIDHNLYTCAGGTAALDMMLTLIREDLGDGVVNRVCEQAITDRVRAPHDRQRVPLTARLGVQHAKVVRAIEIMESNLADPLSLAEIADHVGLSRRQVERLFEREMGLSPARYYLEMRLDRARHLLRQSQLPIVEIAIACGFVSASHFAKCYRELYDRTPQQERAGRLKKAVSAA